MNDELQLKLQAWVDGELSDADSAKMARLAAEDSDAAGLVTALRSLKTSMSGADLPRSLPETGEFYWSKIQRQIQSETRPDSSPEPGLMARWRSFLIPLAGLAAASCVALLTLTQTRPLAHSATDDEFTSSDEAMETTTFRDQSSGLTVVWMQDRDATAPAVATQADEVTD
jgi:hypothetical protein